MKLPSPGDLRKEDYSGYNMPKPLPTVPPPGFKGMLGSMDDMANKSQLWAEQLCGGAKAYNRNKAKFNACVAVELEKNKKLRSPRTEETKCLSALANFEFGTNVGKIVPKDNYVRVLTARKTVNGKSELFVWDGDKIWRVDSPVKIRPWTVNNSQPERGYEEIAGFTQAHKTALWSLSRQRRNGDGMLKKTFPDSALEGLIGDLIATSFSTARALAPQHPDLRSKIAPACVGVDNVKFKTKDHGIITIGEYSKRLMPGANEAVGLKFEPIPEQEQPGATGPAD
jgi:hypothetical protein